MKKLLTKKNSPPLILAIDTSCDETSVAVTLGKVVLSNIIASQAQIHGPYGGVFPTLAKQAHRENIAPCVKKALAQARVKPKMLSAIAVTVGPGLAPALEVGIEHAQVLGEKWGKPVLGINHLEGHLLSVVATTNKRKFPTKKVLQLIEKEQAVSEKLALAYSFGVSMQFPVLGLIFSGGHSQFVQIDTIGKYHILGETIDDALGEALDKVGRMLGLGYPAGPVIEQLAKKGDSCAFSFPLPMTTSHNYNLSYSGLKTAAHRLIKDLSSKHENTQGQSLSPDLTKQTVFDLAASFQEICIKHLCYKLERLLVDKNTPEFKQVWLGGGVSNNTLLRKEIRSVLHKHQLKLITPYNKRLCGDNAAMIGVVGAAKIEFGLAKLAQKLDRKPSWNLGA